MATAMGKKKRRRLVISFSSPFKRCRIKLKAVWRSQNYLPFTFSLQWIGMKEGLANNHVKRDNISKTSAAKLCKIKPSALWQSSRIFLLHKRGSFEPGSVYLGRASLSPCSLAVFVWGCFFFNPCCLEVIEREKTGNEMHYVSLGHKGNRVWMSVRGARESVCVCELWVDLGGPFNPAALHENNVERSRKSGGICSPPVVQYSRLKRHKKKIRVGATNTSSTSDYLWRQGISWVLPNS